MKSNKIYLFVAAVILSGCAFALEKMAGWQEKFDNINQQSSIALPLNWKIDATKIGVDATKFYVRQNSELNKNVLVIDAKTATGGLVCNPSTQVDLNKTPILRWRWRVKNLPVGGDGRFPEKDDQPVAIYVGYSDWLKKKSIAYRWECETPTAESGTAQYGAGMVAVKWYCFRNQKDGVDKWYEEERNIAEDFKKTYGTIPKDFVLTVCGNSQYTKSHTTAEIDYIEFSAQKKHSK
jgi:hypothetical protein